MQWRAPTRQGCPGYKSAQKNGRNRVAGVLLEVRPGRVIPNSSRGVLSLPAERSVWFSWCSRLVTGVARCVCLTQIRGLRTGTPAVRAKSKSPRKAPHKHQAVGTKYKSGTNPSLAHACVLLRTLLVRSALLVCKLFSLGARIANPRTIPLSTRSNSTPASTLASLLHSMGAGHGLLRGREEEAVP